MRSLSIDEGCFVGRTDSLISCSERDEAFLEDVYRLLRVLFGEGVVKEATENQPQVDKLVMPKASGEEEASSFKSPSRA